MLLDWAHRNIFIMFCILDLLAPVAYIANGWACERLLGGNQVELGILAVDLCPVHDCDWVGSSLNACCCESNRSSSQSEGTPWQAPTTSNDGTSNIQHTIGAPTSTSGSTLCVARSWTRNCTCHLVRPLHITADKTSIDINS